jgi:hypothetical protein
VFFPVTVQTFWWLNLSSAHLHLSIYHTSLSIENEILDGKIMLEFCLIQFWQAPTFWRILSKSQQSVNILVIDSIMAKQMNMFKKLHQYLQYGIVGSPLGQEQTYPSNLSTQTN